MPRLLLYDPRGNRVRQAGYQAMQARSPLSISVPVLNVADIASEISFVRRVRGPIDRIDILARGIPGALFLQDESLTIHNAHRLAPACRWAMAANAEVFLHGSFLAAGQPGRDLLSALAQAMVSGRGGVVCGFDSPVYCSWFVGELIPPWVTVVAATAVPGRPVGVAPASPVMAAHMTPQ